MDCLLWTPTLSVVKKLLGHDVQSRAAYTANMRPDGSWVGHAYAGVVMCAEGVATYKCDRVGNMT